VIPLSGPGPLMPPSGPGPLLPLNGPGPRESRLLGFTVLKRVSFVHSLIYLGLLYAAFVAGNPQPATFVLGLTHGLLWIGMSLACLAALRKRVVPLYLAVAVCVLGGLGPFVGSAAFVREQRRRRPGSHPPPKPGPNPATGGAGVPRH
jgi:hypothetical protein